MLPSEGSYFQCVDISAVSDLREELGHLVLPEVRAADFRSKNMTRSTARAIATGRWPKVNSSMATT